MEILISKRGTSKANALLNDYIILLKQSVIDMRTMNEEQRFNRLIDLESIFNSYIDICEDNIFLEVIKSRYKEFIGPSKWKYIFRDIYKNALITQQDNS